MSLLHEQEAYWDNVSGVKEFPVPFDSELFKKYVNIDEKVLDFGCGYGRILNELHQIGFTDLTGIDFSQGMVDRGLGQYPHLALSKCEEGVIPFPDNTFHGVILIAVLTCISESEKQKRLIDEILRVLKVGGILYVRDCMLNTDRRNIERYEKYREKYGEYGVFELPEGAVVRHHSHDYVVELTRSFKRLVFEQKTHSTMNGNKTNGFCYIGRKLTC